MQKGLAPIFIIFLLAAVSLVGVFVYWNQTNVQNPEVITKPTPTSAPDPTANWKTYTNNEYRYFVKYPNESNYSENIYSGQGGNVAVTEFRYSIKGNYAVQVYTYKSQVNPGLNALFSTNPGEKITLAGQEIRKLTETNKEGNEMTVWIGPLEHDGNNYLFVYNALPAKPDQKIQQFDQSIFNQILSTFKFLDSASTTNSKTYSNKKYKFELKIPNDWMIDETIAYNTVLKIGEISDTNHIGDKVKPYVAANLWLDEKSEMSQKTLTNFIKEELECIYGDGKREFSKINNQDVVIVREWPCGQTATEMIIWKRNDNFYLLRTYGLIDNYLPSFKFLE